MNKPSWIAVLAAGALVACATPSPDFDVKIAARGPKACTVTVSLDEDSEVTIDHEPVRVKRCAGRREVVWQLDKDTKNLGWSFDPAAGITIKTTSSVSISCPTVSAGSDRFTCTFGTPSSEEKLSYRIKLVKSTDKRELDPTVFND